MKTFKQYLEEAQNYYHASPLDNLDEIGISPNAGPHVSKGTQGFVYLGTKEYIDEYLSYAKKGEYNIYEVNVDGIKLDHNLPGGQVRTRAFISPDRIFLVDRIYNTPEVHPREQEYLQWMKELGKE